MFFFVFPFFSRKLLCCEELEAQSYYWRSELLASRKHMKFAFERSKRMVMLVDFNGRKNVMAVTYFPI